MKRRCALLILGCAVTAAGCNRPLKHQARPVQVMIEGGGEFPGSLAGKWKADRHGWEFVFEPDGQISAAVISLGRVPIIPGRTTTLPTKSGDQGVFTPGPWTIHYDPATTELTVKITMDHIRVQMGDDILEGSSTDVFTGPISPEGVWQAQWTTFTRYTAHTPEEPSFDLSTDETYGETQPLVFQRSVTQTP